MVGNWRIADQRIGNVGNRNAIGVLDRPIGCRSNSRQQKQFFPSRCPCGQSKNHLDIRQRKRLKIPIFFNSKKFHFENWKQVGAERNCFNYTIRRWFPVANGTMYRSAIIYESHSPGTFQKFSIYWLIGSFCNEQSILKFENWMNGVDLWLELFQFLIDLNWIWLNIQRKRIEFEYSNWIEMNWIEFVF